MKLVGPPNHRHGEEGFSQQWSDHMTASSDVRISQRGHQLFAELPLEILGSILRYAVVFEGQPVHVVTRLDPFQAPDRRAVIPDIGKRGQKVPRLHRFLIGSGNFRLSQAPDPNVVLAPLLVCKKWCYIAGNLFYSHNLFCFSSFGELGCFMSGIGARLQRIQHVELLWIGCQAVTFKINGAGKYTSRRVWPLTQLAHANRLKTLHVYVRESSRAVMRRKHEPRGKVRYDKANTTGQTNYRLTRDMWVLQGKDSIKCLRGLDHILFWDYDLYLANGHLNHPIRDQDFTFTMNNQLRRRRRHAKAREAQFDNLTALLEYLPPADVRNHVQSEIWIEEDDPMYAFNQPDEMTDDDSPSLGPGGINHGHHDDDTDDDDNDDNAPPPSGSRLGSARGVNGADDQSTHVSSPAVTHELDDYHGDSDAAAAMADAPLDGDQGDDEMSDNEQNSDIDGDAVMEDAVQDDDGGDDNGGDDDGGDDDGDDNGHHGVPLHPPAHAAAPDRHNDSSPSLFIDGASPPRGPTPGQAQPSYRFSPPEGTVTAAAAAVSEAEDREASLFVRDEHGADQADLHVTRPRPPQSWEAGGSDDGVSDDESEKKESSSEGDESFEEEKEQVERLPLED